MVWPLIWFVAAGCLAFVGGLARAPWPLVGGFGYLLWRVWQGGLQPRSLEVLFLVGAGLVLYLSAATLPPRAEPWLAGIALVPLGLNAGLGLWNLTARLTPHWRVLDPTSLLPPVWRRWLSWDLYGQDGPWIGPLYFAHPAYPWRTVEESFWGLPHGFLIHPNYWALYLVLGLPLVWWALSSRRRVALVGIWAWVGLLATSRSWVATGAAVGVAGLLSGVLRSWWPRVLSVGVLGSTLGLGVGYWALQGLAPFSLGGRWPVWQLGIEWVWGRAKWTGEGLGFWRVWALWDQGPIWLGSPRHGLPAQDRMAGWWAEAQGEPVQLLFELGLIGLGIGLWWAWSVAWEARKTWSQGDNLGRAWVLVLLVAGLTSLFTIPFRLPATLGLLLLAAGRVRARAAGSCSPLD